MLSKLKQEEEKERFILGAWIGFQMGAGGDKNFGEYLYSLGLMEERVADRKGIELSKEQALAKAGEILAMARKKQEDTKRE